MKKMKKLLALALVFVVVASVAALPAYAAGPEALTTVTRTNFDDGSYIIETVVTEPNLSRASTAKGHKIISYYTLGNVLAWEFIVHGEFYYDGNTSYATKATPEAVVHSGLWKNTESTAYCYGASAVGDGTFKTGIITKTINTKVTCSSQGVLS